MVKLLPPYFLTQYKFEMRSVRYGRMVDVDSCAGGIGMKLTRLLIVMSLLLSALSFGCFDNSQEYPAVMPDDFYFVLEESLSADTLMVLMDTKNGIIGKDLVIDGYISAAYNIPQENLQGIYDLIVQYDIRAYSNQIRYHVRSHAGSDWLAVKDILECTTFLHRFTFCIDGTMYEIKCESSVLWDPADKKYDNLAAFNRIIHSDFYINTPEYQAFPPANGGYI